MCSQVRYIAKFFTTIYSRIRLVEVEGLSNLLHLLQDKSYKIFIIQLLYLQDHDDFEFPESEETVVNISFFLINVSLRNVYVYLEI